MRSPIQLQLSLLSFILAASAFSVSCGSSKAPQSDLSGEISGQAARLPNGLGQGFESDTQTLKANCLTGDTVYVGGPTGEVNYAQDMNFDEVLDTISGGLTVGAKFSILDVKGSADFASKQASDEFSSTIALTSTASVKSAVMQNLKLTEIGASNIEKGAAIDRVRLNCGDEFVSQINYSAKLFVNTKFRFTSAQDKQEFKGSASVSLASIGEIGGQIAKLSDSLKKNSTVSITARQIGGNPEELGRILDESVITCNLADFENKCLPMLKAVVKYAKEDFPKSLANEPVPTSSKGWAQVLFKTDKYADQVILVAGKSTLLVPKDEVPPLSEEIEAVRAKILDEYQAQTQDYERASDLLRDFTLNTTQRSQASEIQNATAKNRNALANLSDVCMKTPAKCFSARTAQLKSVIAYDPTKLSMKLCLKSSDMAGTKWTVSNSNGLKMGDWVLKADGSIDNGLAYANERMWRVDGCLLRFYNWAGVPTTVFDQMDNMNHFVGNFFQQAGLRNIIDRKN